MDLAGKKTVLSEGNGALEGLAWSSDGTEILYSAGTSYYDFEIFAIKLDGKRRSVVQSAGGITVLDVAPDGRMLASRDDQWKEVMALAPGESRERNLSWLELTFAVALTPDGKTLLFTEESSRLGPHYSTGLRQMDGSPVVRLGEGTAVDITRDGKLVLSVVPTDPAQTMVVYPTGPGQPRKLEQGGLVSVETAVFFPDAKRVLTCGHEAGHAVRCYIQDIDGGKPRPITPEGTTDGLVSPDGLLVLARDSAGGQKLYPVDGGAPRPVPGATSDDFVVRFGADGKSLIVVSLWSDVPTKVEKLDLATGRREPYKTLGPADLTGAIQIVPDRPERRRQELRPDRAPHGVAPLPRTGSAVDSSQGPVRKEELMRILSARIHGMLDFVVVVLFLLGPLVMGLGGSPAAISYTLAIVHLLVTLMTRFPAGRWKTIPFVIHGIIELIVGVVLLILPSFEGYSPGSPARRFYLFMGGFILIVWALTAYQGRDAEASNA